MLQMLAKSENKSKKLLTFVPKYRAKQFPNSFDASADMLYCKFCQHSVDWKRAKTTSAHVKNKENAMLCTLSKGKIHIKGKKKQ